ncbi:putative Penicillin-binding protein activator [Gammaproteobacteria bacterium]
MATFGQSSSRVFWVWLIVQGLLGCSSNPKPDEPQTQLQSSREHENQALEYIKRAESGSGAVRADALLSAADAWLKAGRPEEAAAALKSASSLSRDFHTTGRTRLLSARLAQIRKRPMDVLSALEGLPQPTTPTASRLQIADLRAWALIQKGQGANAARVLSDAAPLLVEGELVRANRKALWEALHIVPDDDLAALAASTHPILGPWAELALLQRTHRGNPTAFDSAFKAWQTRHQLHPVTQTLVSELLVQPPPFPPAGPLIPLPPNPPPVANVVPVPMPLASAVLPTPESTTVPPESSPPVLVSSPSSAAPEAAVAASLPIANPQSVPNQVALLLPADGTAAKAANAVRNGFLAAWYASPEKQRPELSFHTFSGGAVRGAYQAAVDGGATLVVGPLAKEEVQSLVKEELSHQALSLNYLPEGTPSPNRLYQFGLSPTDEAKQAAEQAWKEGRTGAFVIAPGGERGERIVQAFRAQWNMLGGTVLHPLVAENVEEVASALRAASSPSGGAPGATFPTESKDFVYLSAPAEVSRRLATLLREVGLTVYASSETLSGNEQDIALSGFKLLEIPWMLSSDRLRTDLERLQPGEFATYRRLYALGIDAFRLSEELPKLEADPRTHIDGATGSLSLDSSRRIVRQETWSRMVEGRLSPLASTP